MPNAMINKYRYNTVTDAIKNLRKDGFTADFYLNNGSIIGKGKTFTAKDLALIVVYRYEGQSDPADEASVYGLKTKDGIKGILVTADGIYSEMDSVSILTKLHQRKGAFTG
jgi:hypothetical protein